MSKKIHIVFKKNVILQKRVACIRLLIMGLSLMFSLPNLNAQKEIVPVHHELKESSKKMKIKIGAKILNKTFKIKIGSYAMSSTKIKNDYSGSSKFLSATFENTNTSTFSTYLTSENKDTAYIDAARNITKKEAESVMLFNFFELQEYELIQDSNVASVFIETNLQRGDHWLLLLSKTEGTHDFSVQDMMLTNQKDRIVFKVIQTKAYGNFIKRPSSGIELYLHKQPVAALQYQSGGDMGYKQYAWISDKLTDHLKLVIAATFASILELLEGANVYGFTE